VFLARSAKFHLHLSSKSVVRNLSIVLVVSCLLIALDLPRIFEIRHQAERAIVYPNFH
jgi:hypothetical protein